jgi:drug/metabolite transporter superfamily protein YnfA
MGRLSLVGEVWMFLRQNKKLWLLPIIVVLLVLGALLIFAQSSALAPFIYTIF